MSRITNTQRWHDSSSRHVTRRGRNQRNQWTIGLQSSDSIFATNAGRISVFSSLSLPASSFDFRSVQREARGSITFKIIPSYRSQPPPCDVRTACSSSMDTSCLSHRSMSKRCSITIRKMTISFLVPKQESSFPLAISFKWFPKMITTGGRERRSSRLEISMNHSSSRITTMARMHRLVLFLRPSYRNGESQRTLLKRPKTAVVRVSPIDMRASVTRRQRRLCGVERRHMPLVSWSIIAECSL